MAIHTTRTFSRPQQAYVLARAYFDAAKKAHEDFGRLMDAECEKLDIPTPFGILPPGHSMWPRAQMLLDRENAAKKLMYEAANNLIDWGVEITLAQRGTPAQKAQIRAMAESVKAKSFVEKLWIDLVALSMRIDPPPEDVTLFPLLYEIDPANNEASGVVHFYCSDLCRNRAVEEDAVSRPYSAGADEVPNRGLICETCSKPLD